MATSKTVMFRIENLQLLGTPPPLDKSSAWQGRQIALLNNGALETMGEIVQLNSKDIELKLAVKPARANQLLLRDAVYCDGLLRTANPCKRSTTLDSNSDDAIDYLTPTTVADIKKVESTPIRPIIRIKPATATLVNGVFGDPLLHLQMHHQSRSMFFDLGDIGRMTARIAHQVSDIFITHAHADHIGGFLSLLRSRIGYFPACRIYGPPGLAQQIAGMVNGILWDRVEDRAPRFEVREWADDHIRRFEIIAGSEYCRPLEDLPLVKGVVWQEPAFTVRAAPLDHGTTVLAYSFEPSMQIKVRGDRLKQHSIPTGRWLQTLKDCVFTNDFSREIELPNGSSSNAASLADKYLILAPGQKISYATDFADTDDNREKLIALAKNSHTLVCESSFMLRDKAQALRTQHLTTAACAFIANAANVQHLLPFHFSKRYDHQASQVYDEIRNFCPMTEIPGYMDRSNVA